MDRHYIGSVTATTHQEKGKITLEMNPSQGTVLPAPQVYVEVHNIGTYKRTDALSLWHKHGVQRWTYTDSKETRGT